MLPLSIASYMCPQTTAYVSSYYHTECLLILQHTCVLIRIRCAPAIERTQPFPERESKRALEGAGGLRCHMPVPCVLKKIMQKKIMPHHTPRGRREGDERPLGHTYSRYYLYVSSDHYVSASLPYTTMCHMLHRCASAIDRLVDTQPRRLVDYGALKTKRALKIPKSCYRVLTALTAT